MKYLLSQFSLMILSVILLYFFSTLPEFLPVDSVDNYDWYKISAVIGVLFVFLQALLSITIFLIQKFIAYGWKEFPEKDFSLKWGIGIAFGIIIVLVLHLLHYLSLFWGVVILIILSVIIIIL